MTHGLLDNANSHCRQRKQIFTTVAEVTTLPEKWGHEALPYGEV